MKEKKHELHWKNFSGHLKSMLYEMFKSDDLSDVTLVTDDQHIVTAHKLVLSASSEYFKYIFKNHVASNPFLRLQGVSSTDLKNILEYA